MIKSFVDTARDHLPGSLLDVVKHYNIVGGVGLAAGAAAGAVFAPVTGAAATAIATLGCSIAAGKTVQLTLVGITNYMCGYQLKNSDDKNDSEFVKEILLISPKSVDQISPGLKNRSSFMEELIQTNPRAIEHAHPRLKGQIINGTQETDLVEQAAAKDPTTLEFAHPNLKSNSEFMKKMCRTHKEAILYVDSSLLNDSEFIKDVLLGDLTNSNKEEVRERVIQTLAILKETKELSTCEKIRAFVTRSSINPSTILSNEPTMSAIAKAFPKEAFKAANPVLHASPTFMCPVILDDITHLKNAKPNILRNIDTMTEIAKKHPKQAYTAVKNLKGADKAATVAERKRFLENPGFMLPVAAHNINVLLDEIEEGTSNPLLSDEAFLSDLILHYPTTKNVVKDVLGAAYDFITTHPKTLLALAKRSPEAVRKLFGDKKFAKNSNPLLTGVGTNKSRNEEFLKNLVLNDITMLEIILSNEDIDEAHDMLTGNTDGMKEIAKKYPEKTLDNAPIRLLEDSEGFLVTVVTAQPDLFSRAAQKIEGKEEKLAFIKTCIKINPKVVMYLPSEEKASLIGSSPYQQLILEILRTGDELFFEYIEASLKKDGKFMTAAAHVNPLVFQYANENLRRDEKYIKNLLSGLSIEKRENAFHCIDPTLKTNEAFLKSIKTLPGLTKAIMKDDVSRGTVIKNRDFFTLDELKALLVDDPKIIGKLVLDPIKALDRELIIKLVTAVPDSIQHIEKLQGSTKAKDLVEEICSQNLAVLTVLQKLPVASTLRRNTYDKLIIDEVFFRNVARKSNVGANKQPDILQFVTNDLLTKKPSIVGDILRIYKDKDKKEFLKRLSFLDRSVLLDRSVPPVSKLEAERKLFEALAKEFGDEVLDYADYRLTEHTKNFFGPNFKLRQAPAVVAPAVVAPVVAP